MSVLSGALALVLLQLAVSNSATGPRLGQLGTDIAHYLARWTDPTVPLIGSTTASTTAATTTAAAPVVTAQYSPTPGLSTYSTLE